MMNPCVVCGKWTSAFNYGANFCNACKIFYRRAMKTENFPSECLKEGNCSKCRFCRYQLCLNAGLSPPARKSTNSGFLSLIKNLEILDNQRKEKVLSYSQLPHLNFNFWAEATYQTTLEFISSLEVYKLLNDTEQMVLVWQSVRKYNTLCFAMRAYTDQRDMVEFPKGVNPLPPELNLYFQNFPCVLYKIRSNVVTKLREISITNDEFLLLSAILICDPVPSMFTESGQSHVDWYQKLYSSTLFQYCQTHYPENGPSRFSDLLSVIGVVIQTIEIDDVKNIFELEPDAYIYLGPYLYETTTDGNVKVHILPFIGLAIISATIVSSIIFIVLFATLCYIRISDLVIASIISARIRSLQRQLFYALVVQTLVPLILMHIPAAIMFAFVFLNIDLGVYSAIVSMTIALYPAVDPIPTMVIVNNYRRTILTYLGLRKTKTSEEGQKRF
ncbi:hypothetical protein B9Z55_017894 [Caenorhabditis nigoni]|uniref:Nuclear receptor domain-containing protein n=1 Tax=Caenorhabditis nigoni TaxID=1611254 RepID=A0A2G5TBJ2_9PELO|nr:hypothetical protein B9Z55_017894 [Caenorhabditis nigoni]